MQIAYDREEIKARGEFGVIWVWFDGINPSKNVRGPHELPTKPTIIFPSGYRCRNRGCRIWVWLCKDHIIVLLALQPWVWY